jgi:hypothetical protein
MYSSLRIATRRTAAPALGAVRNLNVHEYISMEIMNTHGIATPKGFVASTPEEAENIYLKEFAKRTFSIISVSLSNLYCFQKSTFFRLLSRSNANYIRIP